MKFLKSTADIISMPLILLFIYAAAAKLYNFKAARADMFNQPFPLWLKHILLYALPIIEIVIAVLLIPDRTQRLALKAFITVMLAFDIYTILILAQVFPYVPCACGGVIRVLSWPQHLVFNLFFTILGFWALYLNYKENRGLNPES